MGLLFCVVAVLGAFWCTKRSLGWGLSWVLAVGYSYGILRARYLDGVSHFMFDAAVAGLYLAVFSVRAAGETKARQQRVKSWFWALAIWPLVTVVLSPLLPSQPMLVQLVGLRTSLYFLPLLLVAARVTREDLNRLAKSALVLNLAAFAFAVVQLRMGIEPFFPMNAATEIMYSSNDVGEERLYRIPSFFMSAHAFGGTMLFSIPLLIHCATKRLWSPYITLPAIALTVLNIFISSTRSPVVQLAVMALILFVVTKPQVRVWAAAGVAALTVSYVVATTPRFQRFATLSDTQYVESRVGGSLNSSLFDIMLDNPLGRGPASASGTSIPYFLQADALPQIGFENEFSRIALEQGIIGLGLWLAFILVTVGRLPRRADVSPVFSFRAVWALVVVLWMTAGIGTGMLSSIPALLLLLLYMGTLHAAPPAQEPMWRPVLPHRASPDSQRLSAPR